ncbi:hypothetical protein MSPP1_003127 [Malassezia sp. CBS 17886]|nr:hypothetical protein MSPP1_003127 [Malassezia sp. CBS 17886]
MRQTVLSWGGRDLAVHVSADERPARAARRGSGGRKATRPGRTRARQPPPELPLLYEGSLPSANVFARIYVYECVARFVDVDVLGATAARLDAIHCWDHAVARAILDALATPAAGLSALHAGQAAAGMGDLVRALRTHADTHANAPWAALATYLTQHAVHLPPWALADVDVDVPPRSTDPLPRGVVHRAEAAVPRRTRGRARLEEQAVATLADSGGDATTDTDDEGAFGVRRSRRAGQLAVRRRRAEMQQRAHAVLERAEERAPPPPVDNAPPMHLETKVACLAQLCDALCLVAPRASDSAVRQALSAAVELLPGVERRARERVAALRQQCDEEMRALRRRAPSVASPRYRAWKADAQQLAHAHDAALRAAAVEEELQLRRLALRSGPLGRDAAGNEYWHLLPVCAPAAAAACDMRCAGVAHAFHGHWSHVLVMYGAQPRAGERGDGGGGEPRFYGTHDAESMSRRAYCAWSRNEGGVATDADGGHSSAEAGHGHAADADGGHSCTDTLSETGSDAT